MSTKITVAEVASILKSHKDISPATLRAVVEQMNEAVQPAADEDIKPSAPKKQFVVVVSDPEGKLKQDLVGWVAQIPEDASPMSVIDRVNRAAHDFNASKKGRLLPVKSVGEAFESVAAKYFKESEAWVKTKMPIYIIRTDNQLSEPPTA